MKKRKKPQLIAQLEPNELQLIFKISSDMENFVWNFDYHTNVQMLLKKLKKKHFGVQLFLVSNILNFSPGHWYKPEELKNRFETHMKFEANKNKNLVGHDNNLGDSNSINSKDVNTALKQLEKRLSFKNITGTKKMKKVLHRHLKFDGYPSVWDFPDTINLVKSILDKEMTFNSIYLSFLKSGLLYNYWTCYFLIYLGCLEAINLKDIKSTQQIFLNLYASAPEKIKNKIPPEVYIQRLMALRNQVLKLTDAELIKNAGKMAGYIIKSQRGLSVFGVHWNPGAAKPDTGLTEPQ